MDRKKAMQILSLLKKHYPNANIMLARNKFQLLIATILSAQTADKQTVGVAKKLFARYKNAEQPVSYTHLTLPTICSV